MSSRLSNNWVYRERRKAVEAFTGATVVSENHQAGWSKYVLDDGRRVTETRKSGGGMTLKVEGRL